MASDLVGIGLPVFNGAEYLEQTLDSLLAQTYRNFELVICDNASTDSTAEICRAYAARDSRIQYVRNDTNIGGTANSLKVFELSSGPYFMWASCHDLWSSDFIEKCVGVLDNDSGVALVYARSYWIDVAGEVIEPVEGVIETRGKSRKARVNHVLWAFQNGAPIFGIFRRSALSQVQLGGKMIGPDRAALYEIAFLGDIAFEPDCRFYFRRTEGDGSLRLYLRKMIGREPSRKDFKSMMRNLYRAHFSAIMRHYRSRRAWPGLMLSCWYGLRTQYSGFFGKRSNR